MIKMKIHTSDINHFNDINLKCDKEELTYLKRVLVDVRDLKNICWKSFDQNRLGFLRRE